MTIFADVTLNDFSTKVNTVAMPNRFIVEFSSSNIINNRSAVSTADLRFFCTKAIIPEVSVSGPTINFRGTKMMLSGDPKTGSLVLGFLNANNWKVRNYFEDWLSSIKDYQGIKKNEIINTGVKFSDINYCDLVVKQIDGAYRVLAQYNFYGAIPLEMTSIDLSTEAGSANEMFDVTFQYSHWFRGIDGNGVEEIGEHPVVEEQDEVEGDY